jgi:hypothetical protein
MRLIDARHEYEIAPELGMSLSAVQSHVEKKENALVQARGNFPVSIKATIYRGGPAHSDFPRLASPHPLRPGSGRGERAPTTTTTDVNHEY